MHDLCVCKMGNFFKLYFIVITHIFKNYNFCIVYCSFNQETLSFDTYTNSHKTVIINELFINVFKLMHAV